MAQGQMGFSSAQQTPPCLVEEKVLRSFSTQSVKSAGMNELSALLLSAGKLLGHHGVARSLIGLGFRVPWTNVAESRKLQRPDDPKWTEQNIAICDRLVYALKKCPAGAVATDIVKTMGQLNWPILPQRQVIKGDNCTWWVSAEKEPAE